MNIVFFGSSDFSIEALKACLDSSHRVSLVITTPDQKKGRGLVVMPSSVKKFCQSRGIPVEAPEKLRDAVWTGKVRDLKPDLFVVSSYGKLIPSSWLSIPAKVALNVHPSLLPKYRGASPLHWPIINGDEQSGVSIAEVTDKLDSGDIFAQVPMVLPARIDSQELSRQLAKLSYEVLSSVLKDLDAGTLKRIPQDDACSSYARKLQKDDGLLDFRQPAATLDRLIRGLKPWPGCYFEFQNSHVIVLDAEAVASDVTAAPGAFVRLDHDKSISVATAKGLLKIKQVKPSGKNPMRAADFVRGRRIETGFIFGAR